MITLQNDSSLHNAKIFFLFFSTLYTSIDKLGESGIYGEVKSITEEYGNLGSRKVNAPFMEIVRSRVNEKTSVIRTWRSIHMVVQFSL